jgi:hypothetical protein
MFPLSAEHWSNLMTDPTPLSPAAQAVWNAANNSSAYGPEDCLNEARQIAAAALRAAADQVVPTDPCGDDCCITQCEQIRAELLAIAAELEDLDA